MDASTHSVGLRQLRHQTSAVLARVSEGETLDITSRGRLVARIVPASEPAPAPVIESLVAAGRLTRAQRPGYRPSRRLGTERDRQGGLGAALVALRDEENW